MNYEVLPIIKLILRLLTESGILSLFFTNGSWALLENPLVASRSNQLYHYICETMWTLLVNTGPENEIR